MKRIIGAWVGLAALIFVFALSDSVHAAALTADQAIDIAADLAAQGNQLATHRKTGKLIFVGGKAGGPIDADLPTTARTSLPQTRSAMDYMNLLAPAFGLDNPESDTRIVRSKSDRRVQHTRYQQLHNNVPVIGGELLVNQDAGSNLLSMSGRIAPALTVDTKPTIAANEANQTGLIAVGKWHGLNPDRLAVTRSELSIFAPELIDGAGNGPTRLVWRLELSSTGLDPVREFVLVDALTGDILLHFNQIHFARNRMTYDTNSSAAVPGTLVCNEGDSTCNGIVDAATVHLYTADTYDYYKNHFNRDSIDGAGQTITSTVRYCPTSAPADCPYINAYWSGTQMVYGAGYTGDDVVAHELTHGVTQNESGLFYYYQSGAINEAISDIFGEFVDLGNGHGDDSPAAFWIHREDYVSGPNRSLANPPTYGDPDRMKSPLFYTGSGDVGGVHTNSGVANKAAYLMAVGGTFNGQTIVALGNDKSAAVWYEAQTNLLFSAADYLDLYNALFQACLNLVGTVGITATDCDQVRNATLATEMNQDPFPNYLPEALVCPVGQLPVTTYLENWEAGMANWTRLGAINTGAGNTIWFLSNEYPASKPTSIFGRDSAFGPYDSSLAMSSSILIPAGAFLRIEHAYGFDVNSAGTIFYDGGVVESSINSGGSWQARVANSGQGYGGTLSSSFSNPLAGRSAFVGASHGYVSSRFDLSTLAGQSARFRFRIGTDTSVASLGWFIDNVHIYTCAVPQVLQFGSATQGVGEGGGTVTIPVTRTGGTTGTVSATYATANGSATAGSDYTATSGTLTFLPGIATMNVIVPITDDTQVESAETFTVTLSSPVGATLGATTTTTVTITDNDVAPAQSLLLSAATYSVSEGLPAAGITVMRVGGTTGTVSVNYATANGTATAGSDYTSTSGVLTFGPGISSQLIIVPIIGDVTVEPDETFTVTLSNPSGAALGSPSVATVTILDDDTFTLTTKALGTGGGGIVSSNVAGISCGGDCSEPYARNTLVTLTATPFPGSVFSGWGNTCPGFGDCTVAMTAAKEVTGTFVFTGSPAAYDYVQKAYVAYYGRPGDPPGQAYWAGRVDDAGGSIGAIIDSFGNSNEFNSRYGGLSYSDLVTKIYQQALSRDPDAGGLAYYIGELQAGRRTLQSITLDVLNGASTPPDSTIVANKLDVSAYYSAAVALGCPYGTELDGVNLIAGVLANPSTVTAAKAFINNKCTP